MTRTCRVSTFRRCRARRARIWANVSKQAWEEWQALQTRLINEKHLNMMDADSRRYLMEQMERFFRNEETDQAEGFVPTDAAAKGEAQGGQGYEV